MGYGRGGTYRQDLKARHGGIQRRYTFGSHAQTCHVWAQQSGETVNGQSSDGRIRFEGPTIYSYGHHFAVAHFAKPDLVLFNAASYSVTTGGHKSEVRGALYGLDLQIIDVPDLTAHLRGDKTQARAAYEDALEHLAYAARIHANPPSWAYADYFTHEIKEARDAVNALRALFKIKTPMPVDVVAWSDKRAAKAQKKRDAEKLTNAIETIGKRALTLTDIKEKYRADLGAVDMWQVRVALSRINIHLKKLRSARLTVSKAKRVTYVKRASATIKILEPLQRAWQAAMDAARERDRLARQLEDVKVWQEERDSLTHWQYPHHNSPDMLGDMLARAIKEGLHDAAERINRRLQLLHLAEETAPKHVPRKKERDALKTWLAGGRVETWSLPQEPTYLRRKGDTLETSRGASVPWPDAVRAFQFAQACRANGKAWQRNGEQVPVGHFQVDSIFPNGDLKAGCHLLAWNDMQALAIAEAPAIVLPRYPLPMVLA